MRPSILLTMLLSALCVIASGCANGSCPTCGTTTGGAYTNLINIPVPEHNPTGEPGGPFNSFDISWVDPIHHLDYVSDRIGLAVPVVDTINNVALFAIQGSNAVTGAGDQASPCVSVTTPIPPIVDVLGNFTRFGCRTDLSGAAPPGPTFHLISGFGANGNFGGFPGAQCCASRANGVNPMSGPDGLEVDETNGNTLFVGNGSSSVVVFDLTPMFPTLGQPIPTQPNVIAAIPTGVSADYDGPLGIGPCVESWNGEAGSAADCGDDRADEMAFDEHHKVLAIINGDPGFPFVTFIDMTDIVNRAGNCLPIDSTLAYGPYPAGIGSPPFDPATYPFQGTASGLTGVPQSSPLLDPGVAGTSFNPPSCIIGQIYYDGAGAFKAGLSPGVTVDTISGAFPCPDASNPHVFSGVSGSFAADSAAGSPGYGVTPSGAHYNIPCHHGPLLIQTGAPAGSFCFQDGSQGGCAGAIAPAGLGGNAWWFDSTTGKSFLLQANLNSIGSATNIGNIDVIDPIGVESESCTPTHPYPGHPHSCGPIVVNSFVTPNCMPASVVQGPGNNFLIGCGDHDGEAFPPNEIVVSLSPDPVLGAKFTQLAEITQVGGVDEIWYNPGDNKYYTASRDMPNGPVMGVIDAGTNTWLVNVPTNSNSHSISVDPSNNHAFVPLQAGSPCGNQSSNGCIGVYGTQ